MEESRRRRGFLFPEHRMSLSLLLSPRRLLSAPARLLLGALLTLAFRPQLSGQCQARQSRLLPACLRGNADSA